MYAKRNSDFGLLVFHFHTAQRTFLFFRIFDCTTWFGNYNLLLMYHPSEYLTIVKGWEAFLPMLRWTGQNIRLRESKPQRCRRPVGGWIMNELPNFKRSYPELCTLTGLASHANRRDPVTSPPMKSVF